jgi:hypothetical protein
VQEPGNSPGLQIKCTVQAQLPAFNPTFSGVGGKEQEEEEREEITYVISCCPWATAKAADLAEEIFRREKASRIGVGYVKGVWARRNKSPLNLNVPPSPGGAEAGEQEWEDDGTATGFASHAVTVMMGLIRSCADSVLNKFDRSCGMPPFLDDGSVRYVAEGMIEAAKVAGDWVERNETMIPEGTKETVGGIERSSHVKANEIIHLNGGTVTKRKLRGENRIEHLYPDDSNDGNEKAGAMMVKSKKKEKEKEKEKEMVEMEAPEIMKVRKKAKVAAKERPRKLYEDDMDVDGNDDGDGDDKGNSVATSVTAPWGYDSDGDPMTEYQRLRHDKIQRNKAHLEGLGLNKVKDALKAMSTPSPRVPYTSAEKNCIKYAAPTFDTMYPHMTASKRWENVLATYPDIFQNSRSAINLQNQYNKMLTKVGGQAGKLLCVHPSIFEEDTLEDESYESPCERKVEKEKRKRQKEKEVEKREIAKKKKVAKQQENTFEYPKTKMPPSSLVEEVRNGKRGGARDYKGELTRGAERGRRGSRSHTH